MQHITIISNFPTQLNEKEGMIQRVKHIDSLFTHTNRKYINISFRSNLKKSFEKKDNFSIVNLNFFLHAFYILLILFKSEKIYIHSLYNFARIFPFILFINKPIILDIHGVIPEELEFNGFKIKSFFYNFIEYFAFKKSTFFIFISNSMCNFYKQKYPSNIYENKSIVYSIFPVNVCKKTSEKDLNSLKKQFQIKNTDTVFLYSGNTQKWQNVDLLINAIKTLYTNDSYKFFILTGEPIEMQKYLSMQSLQSAKNIYVLSLPPDQIAPYYSLSHYGFILRDKHILNKVANPTKLIEYLFFGLIPIVKSADIGDFLLYEYQYLRIDEVNTKLLSPYKSLQNETVANLIISNNTENISTLQNIINKSDKSHV